VTAGSVRLKSKEYAADLNPVDDQCECTTCSNYSRAVLHTMFREGSALAAQLLTKHNVSYMMRLMRTMRQVRSAHVVQRYAM
jgi:tRNA-guanine family transglycosylase